MRKFVFLLGFTGAALVVCMAAACSSNTPNDGRIDLPGRDDDTDAKADVSTTPTTDADTALSCTNLALKVGEPAACDQCAKEKCCPEVTACNKSTDCKGLQECIEPCAQDDFICIGTCQEGYPSGNETLLAVGQCARSNCKTECAADTPDGDIFADSGL